MRPRSPAWGVSGEVELGARFSAANAAALWAGKGGRAGGGSRGNAGLRAGGWSPRVQVRDLAARWRQAGSDSDSPSLWRPGFWSLRALRLHRCLWHTSCCPLLRTWVLSFWHGSEAAVSRWNWTPASLIWGRENWGDSPSSDCVTFGHANRPRWVSLRCLNVYKELYSDLWKLPFDPAL